MTGDNFHTARQLWATIADGTFADGVLAELLVAIWKQWTPGTLAAELARALLEEARSREADPEAEAIDLAEIEELPKTQRIDGIMPLTIPQAADVRWMADELVQEAVRRQLGDLPDDLDHAKNEISLAYLALLHRRPMLTEHGLRMRLNAAAPGDSFTAGRETLMLFGQLPMGGRVSVFFSALLAAKHCDFTADACEHFDRLQLKRTADGQLKLTAGPDRTSPPKEKWTFRL